jgi:hypothetical protein
MVVQGGCQIVVEAEVVCSCSRWSGKVQAQAVRPFAAAAACPECPRSGKSRLKEMERVVFKLQCRDQCGFTTAVVATADTEREPTLVPAINSCASDTLHDCGLGLTGATRQHDRSFFFVAGAPDQVNRLCISCIYAVRFGPIASNRAFCSSVKVA